MHNKIQHTLAQFVPFAVLGISIAFAVALLIMFSYVLIWGLMIGAIIWGGAVLIRLISPNKAKTQKKGRIIDYHEDE